MRAAWITGNKHTMILTPNFDLNSSYFQNSALDPRKIGFYINNEDKLILFINSLKSFFKIVDNPVLINQKIKEFLNKIETDSENELQEKQVEKIITNANSKIIPEKKLSNSVII